MNKLNQLKTIIAKHHDATKTDVFVDKGKIKQANIKSLPFRNDYDVFIYLDQFSGQTAPLFVDLLAFLQAVEPEQTQEQRFTYSVIIERETEAFLEIQIALSDSHNVMKDVQGEIHADVC